MSWCHRLRSCAWKSECPATPSNHSFRLPLHLTTLLPLLFSNVTTEKEVLEYLKNGTLVGLLPIPHPILIRKYQVSVM